MLVRLLSKVSDEMHCQSVESDRVVVPWLFPEFLDQPEFKEKLREEILTLSKDLDTFLNDVEGCEDEKYSPEKNYQLIVQLREKDSRLQKARFLLVQRDNLIDVIFGL